MIGNCQAGWSIMMVAALRPELFGPIIVAGTPLSYWAGVRGANPMRYSGGLLGGSWLTALTGDAGAGVFDGAWLVQNFENQNPANTLWSKQYNLWSKIDCGQAQVSDPLRPRDINTLRCRSASGPPADPQMARD